MQFYLELISVTEKEVPHKGRGIPLRLKLSNKVTSTTLLGLLQHHIMEYSRIQGTFYQNLALRQPV